MMSPPGFNARVGSALFTFCGGDCNVCSLRSTPGATPANFLTVSIMRWQFKIVAQCCHLLVKLPKPWPGFEPWPHVQELR